MSERRYDTVPDKRYDFVPEKRYDIVIAGAGFAGTLTALALKNIGFHVCVIEKGKHPRFAIGESSTPIADMILRSLAAKYDLPWLHDFSRYGSWQTAYPEIGCGIKRGFSYYKHYPGKEFSTDARHSNELLVAASVSDTMSDTNWLRADFDAFLVGKVVENDIDYFDGTEMVGAAREKKEWLFTASRNEGAMVVRASFFIDATGSGLLAEKLFAVRSSVTDFHTNSFAVFSHFDNLPRWTAFLHQKNISTADYPYDADHSALHHVLDEGWIWALRFNDNRLSWGFALNGEDAGWEKMSTDEIWQMMRKRYPDIDMLLSQANLSSSPGSILRSGRLQRKLESSFGEGWVAMPHTVGFVDPLFSTGIAYSLAGIERIVEMLSENRDFGQSLYDRLKEYEQVVSAELKLIDLLVAGCYQTMRYFPLFNAWSMLYFTFTIAYEQKRLKNLPVHYFLEASNPAILQVAYTTYEELLALLKGPVSEEEMLHFTNRVRERIAPFNTVGLLDPDFRNMYQHTVAKL